MLAFKKYQRVAMLRVYHHFDLDIFLINSESKQIFFKLKIKYIKKKK